jgi:ATP-dependent Lon protease
MNFSVKLVEQELWQREEKGLIGILPVRDAAAASSSETASAGPTLSQGKTRDPFVFLISLFGSV